ncbi:hypothetical protein [Roseibium aggregatum]|uniref:hypothetical protein n=1 Tax=Roseibium aggregatum TaxID=187304 RepID=UPI003A97C676
MNLRNKTHTDRWVTEESYRKNWKLRAIDLMNLFLENEYLEGSKYKIAEFGCGVYSPFHCLFDGKDGFEVQKFDIKKWDADTEILNFNVAKVSIPSVNIAVFSGVLEYVNDVPNTLKNVMENSDFILMSYAFLPSAFFLDEDKYLSSIENRAVSHGWRNHYSNKDIVEMVSRIGVISAVGVWNKNQSLFLLRNYKIDKS